MCFLFWPSTHNTAPCLTMYPDCRKSCQPASYRTFTGPIPPQYRPYTVCKNIHKNKRKFAYRSVTGYLPTTYRLLTGYIPPSGECLPWYYHAPTTLHRLGWKVGRQNIVCTWIRPDVQYRESMQYKHDTNAALPNESTLIEVQYHIEVCMTYM